MRSPSSIREAPFALRVTQRKGGRAAIIYRRSGDAEGRDRLQRIGALNPLAFRAALPMLREAALSAMAPEKRGAISSPQEALLVGPYRPMGEDWGARGACFAIISAGLLDGERVLRSAGHLRQADPDQAAWWLGLLTQEDNVRALRALRILTEAVQ